MHVQNRKDIRPVNRIELREREREGGGREGGRETQYYIYYTLHTCTHTHICTCRWVGMLKL